MGRTGETYLVGKNHSKTAFRSTMLTMGDGKYVVGYALTTPYIDKALAGEADEDIFTDSAGRLVLMAYEPLSIEGLNWAIISKIDLEEVIAPKLQEQEQDFYANYIKTHGYYDFFLIHPEGEVFYTVAREADYGTNMVNGKYADSGLGKLVKSVLRSKRYGVADVELYAPSNGEPALFVARPTLLRGEIELIVALQLPSEVINGIMQQREGMGKTGETYLVGADMRMRSDAYLDPEHRSVMASLAGTVERNGVDTEAVRAARSGEKGVRIINNYKGNRVLSAYTPISLGDLTWALLAEIDEAEIAQPILALAKSVLFLGLIIAGIVVAIAFLFSRAITRPIHETVHVAKRMAKGDLTVAIDADAQDEIGQMLRALGGMLRSLTQVISDVRGTAYSLSSASEEMGAFPKYDIVLASEAAS